MKERGNTVLVVDGGGRGTALVRKYSQSPQVDRIIAVPGNDWMLKVSEKPVKIFPQIKTSDTVKIVNLCKELSVDLVDIAQDNAVQAGLTNMLNLSEISAVGPTMEAGRLEWDKNYARAFGHFFKLPQPLYKACSAERQAEEFLDSQENTRWFVKAAGLAEGKGVISATSKQEVLDAIKWLKKEYPDSAKIFLIEEWLEGEEFSAFAVSDSRNFRILGYAQDHKREYDGDQGENTGGMGAVSHPLLTNDLELQRKIKNIFATTINGERDAGSGYRGILYLGGMAVEINGQLKPYIIEFNARWGDPEAEVILPGITNDWLEVGMAVANGDINNLEIKNDGKVRIAVAGVAKGYPRKSEYSQLRGKQIFGLDEAGKVNGVIIYGAGVKIINGKHYADRGRLFYVVGEGKDVLQARERVDEAFEKISIEGDHLRRRKDVGWKDVERLKR